ncbi:MAG TPA: hypothetical protein P5150_08415 [Candidatus Ratteibacteria bacterium]|nr:hypothetical protein [Candidatus Ratteibacteria bacterium]
MNKIERWFLRRYINKQIKGGNKMFQIILVVLSYIVKNIALIVGILESLMKVIAGIVSLTSTKRDDAFIPVIDKFFSSIKRILYNLSDVMVGKEIK